MKLNAKRKIILIVSVLALVVSAFSVTTAVLVNRKEQNPEVQQTGAASTYNFANGAFYESNTTHVNTYEAATKFQISSITGLVNFSITVSSSFTFSGKTVELTNDIFAHRSSILPIGSYTANGAGMYLGQSIGDDITTAFQGTFNGNGHTIQSLAIDYSTITFKDSNVNPDNPNSSATKCDMGLFLGLKGATVENLRLDNVLFLTPNNRIAGGVDYQFNIAGISPNVTNSTISQCAVQNMVIDNYSYVKTTQTNYVAGIGLESTSATIKDCYVNTLYVCNKQYQGTNSYGEEYTYIKKQTINIYAVSNSNVSTCSVDGIFWCFDYTFLNVDDGWVNAVQDPTWVEFGSNVSNNIYGTMFNVGNGAVGERVIPGGGIADIEHKLENYSWVYENNKTTFDTEAYNNFKISNSTSNTYYYKEGNKTSVSNFDISDVLNGGSTIWFREINNENYQTPQLRKFLDLKIFICRSADASKILVLSNNDIDGDNSNNEVKLYMLKGDTIELNETEKKSNPLSLYGATINVTPPSGSIYGFAVWYQSEEDGIQVLTAGYKKADEITITFENADIWHYNTTYGQYIETDDATGESIYDEREFTKLSDTIAPTKSISVPKNSLLKVWFNTYQIVYQFADSNEVIIDYVKYDLRYKTTDYVNLKCVYTGFNENGSNPAETGEFILPTDFTDAEDIELDNIRNYFNLGTKDIVVKPVFFVKRATINLTKSVEFESGNGISPEVYNSYVELSKINGSKSFKVDLGSTLEVAIHGGVNGISVLALDNDGMHYKLDTRFYYISIYSGSDSSGNSSTYFKSVTFNLGETTTIYSNLIPKFGTNTEINALVDSIFEENEDASVQVTKGGTIDCLFIAVDRTLNFSPVENATLYKYDGSSYDSWETVSSISIPYLSFVNWSITTESVLTFDSDAVVDYSATALTFEFMKNGSSEYETVKYVYFADEGYTCVAPDLSRYLFFTEELIAEENSSNLYNWFEYGSILNNITPVFELPEGVEGVIRVYFYNVQNATLYVNGNKYNRECYSARVDSQTMDVSEITSKITEVTYNFVDINGNNIAIEYICEGEYYIIADGLWDEYYISRMRDIWPILDKDTPEPEPDPTSMLITFNQTTGLEMVKFNVSRGGTILNNQTSYSYYIIFSSNMAVGRNVDESDNDYDVHTFEITYGSTVLLTVDYKVEKKYTLIVHTQILNNHLVITPEVVLKGYGGNFEGEGVQE